MTSARPEGPPPPLVVAASLVAIEALLLVLFGVAELVNVSSGRLAMGLTTALFFVLFGGFLAFCAWAMARGASWARAPIVLAQLIQLGVAWSFRGGETTLLAVLLAVVGAVTLLGVFHPASVEHLTDEA